MVNNSKIEYDIDRIGNVLGHLDTVLYGCSFVVKLSWKKKIIFWKKIYVFYKIYIIYRKTMFLYGEKVL